MNKYSKIFQIFSQQSTNTVNREMIPNLLRQAGHTLLEKEAQMIVMKFKEENVTMEQFIALANELKFNAVNMEKIKAAFRLFDYDNVGYIDVRTLKVILQDEFDELEVEEIVRAMNPDDDGRINYTSVLKMLEA